MNASEPLSYASKTLDRRHQNQGLGALLGSVRRSPIYRSHGVRCREGMNSVLASYTELEKLLGDAKGKRTSEKHSLGENTDALCSGGPSRSSDEAE